MPSYFEPVGGADTLTFAPTELTQGAWRDDEQHVSVLAGLAAHVVAQHEPRNDMLASRLGFEIFGQIPIGEVTFSVETVRPGRTIELVAAEARIGGRTVLQTRVWRLQRSDTAAIAGLEMAPMPPPGECEPYDGDAQWQGNFLATLEWRAAAGGRDGRRQVWARTPVDLIGGVAASPLARFVAMVDLANGIATRRHPRDVMFPNVELTIHLLRDPDPAWVGLDTSVSFGASGVGLTSTTLHDLTGPIGRAEQSLTLRV